MKKGFGKFFNKSASSQQAAAQLSHDMLQAFFRPEHDTIEHLEKRGAPFMEEMLSISIGFRDLFLTGKCLSKGVKPTEEHIRLAVDGKDAEIFKTVSEKATLTETSKKYVADFGTKEMRAALSLTVKKDEDHPVLSINPAMLSVP